MIDIVIEDDRWAAANLQDIAERAALQVCAALKLDASAIETAVLACDDARIAELNAEFREKPTATNVLSWPAADLSAEIDGADPAQATPDPTGMIELGDIAISYDTCTREAAQAGKSITNHTTHLMIHGLLHLLGYDHIRDQDATLMEAIEVRILGKMGIDDPYSAGQAE